MAPAQASIPLKDDPTARRSYLSETLVERVPGFEEVETMYDVFPSLAKRFGDRPAVASREVIAVVEEEKTFKKMVAGKEVEEVKKWKYWTLSDFKYITYNELFKRTVDTASGLQHLGIQPQAHVGLYSDTSANWQIFAHACARARIIYTTSYATLGLSGLAYSLTEPEVQAVYTQGALLSTLNTVLIKGAQAQKDGRTDEEGGGLDVRFVIYDGKLEDEPVAASLEALLKARGGSMIHLAEVQEIGRQHPGNFDQKPQRTDTSSIMFTSGSMGQPKGCVITQHNMISSLGGVFLIAHPFFKKGDTFLAFLPLAHSIEMLTELIMLFDGIPIGYGSVKTLTDASVRNCEGDLKAFKPSIIVAVPQIMETIRKGIVGKVNAGSAVSQKVFSLAVRVRGWPVLGSVADTVVFSKVREATGGRLRKAMNGGSALNNHTRLYLQKMLNMELFSGYGLSETCGMANIGAANFFNQSGVGPIVPSMLIKLRDFPDAGYLGTNNPPQGEILLKGNSVMKSYYKRPELDKEAFTEDGWLITGDVGQWEADGTLTIIDRTKNLVKLSSGEYVALESLEKTYKYANILSNLCVYASSDCHRPIAIATLHEPNFRHFVAHLPRGPIANIDPATTSLHTLVRNPDVIAAVLAEALRVGKGAGLKGQDLLGGMILDDEEWLPETGLVTATMKLQRKAIKEKFANDIQNIIDNDGQGVRAKL